MPTTTTKPRIERANGACCPCGDGAAKFCRGCDVAYCERCCAKRHAKGSFQRHAIEDIAAAHSEPLARDGASSASGAGASAAAVSVCEECLQTPAVLACKACELNFCATCSSQVHQIGTMQSHVTSGSFAFFGNGDDGYGDAHASLAAAKQSIETDGGSSSVQQSSWESSARQSQIVKRDNMDPEAPDAPAQQLIHSSSSGAGRDAFGLKAAVIRDGEATETLVDPDQEVAPCSPALSKDAADAESYDLWSSWSVRSFSDRSSSIDSTSQWRNLRSLSIDSTTAASAAPAGDDELPLTSISKSLQSLAFVPPAQSETKLASKTSPQMFPQRPRSYSDYTSLRSHAMGSGGAAAAGGDLWQEPGANASRSSSAESVGSSSSFHSPLVSSMELWKAMKTNFPSRHLLVKSVNDSFDAAEVQRIRDNLKSFGTVARIRDEFAAEGLLFFTYFELKCAIGAVKSWFSGTTNSSTASSASRQSPNRFSPSRAAFPGSEVVHFCLPYELPDDVNCATLLVRLNGPPVSSTEMRQFCSRYGEVASVLQNDINSSRYILEYNDARDVPAAMSGLASSFHAPSGSSIDAVRTNPPTLDMAKIQLFQECVDSIVAAGAATRHMSSLDLGMAPRPTSFSSSTASLLTSSPTSTSSSPLSPSPFLELSSESGMGSTSTAAVVDAAAEGRGRSAQSSSAARATSPFDGGIYQMRNSTSALSDDHQIWSGGSGGSSASVSSSMRPRSSSSSLIGLGSARASAIGGGSSSSFSPDHGHPYSNPYSAGMSAAVTAGATSSDTFPPYMQHGAAGASTSGSHFHQQHLQQRLMTASGVSSKYGAPVRSGSDPNFRSGGSSFSNSNNNTSGGGFHSSASSNASSTGQHAVIGRNDQGIGEFSLSIERVASGDDKRTTLMIRNIPNKYTQQMLLSEINARHRGNYDFFYLPIDFKNKCNMGYAFINFMEAESIIPFYKEFDSQKWTNFNSEKVCAISYARLQGKQAMITRFQNSSLLEKHESYRPLVFVSSGVNRGKPETFPAPKQPQHHSHHHHHKKQLMHPHHQHQLMMGGVDDFGGVGASGHAASRMYMQNHHHHQQQQQQLQAMHHAHQFMAANQHLHAAGLQALALGAQGGANPSLHMNFHGGLPLSSPAHHHIQQQQHAQTYQQQQYQNQQQLQSQQQLSAAAAAKAMSMAFANVNAQHATGFSP